MNETKTQDGGQGYAPPAGSALIRRCDKCQMTTAINLDATLENKREMQFLGQTVHEVTKAQALEAWETAGPCRCRPNASHEAERRSVADE